MAFRVIDRGYICKRAEILGKHILFINMTYDIVILNKIYTAYIKHQIGQADYMEYRSIELISKTVYSNIKQLFYIMCKLLLISF